MVRAFLAIDLPLSLKKEVSKFIESFFKGQAKKEQDFVLEVELKKNGRAKEEAHTQRDAQDFGRIKWVEEENLHLTLIFFGNIPDNDVEKIVKLCEKRLKEFPPFELYLTEISGFPKNGDYRVVFLGCEERSNTLAKLVKELTKDFKEVGFKLEERDFHPHITLFRLKELYDPLKYKAFVADIAKKANIFKGRSFVVKDIVLFESKLTPTGPKYSPIKIFALAGE